MAETIFYRPHWSQLAADGTLSLPASIYDDCSHSSALIEVPPTAEAYAFWRWVVTQERFARVLDERAVADARAEFDSSRRGDEGTCDAAPIV